MRALLLSFAMLAFLAVGCEEAPVAKTVKGTPVGGSASGSSNTDAETAETAETAGVDGAELDEVDAAGLEAAMAANDVTLIEFTATW